MNIDYQKLAQALEESGLMHKAPSAMTKEEIEKLCRIVTWLAVPAGAEDVPF